MKDGGNAFPQRVVNGDQYNESGMTLRDYFAGQALAGQIAASFHIDGKEHARCAYQVADAMLKERES